MMQYTVITESSQEMKSRTGFRSQAAPATVLFVKDLYEQCTGVPVW
mgnify:CR=1 FL=1|jgi:hypothetical protein